MYIIYATAKLHQSLIYEAGNQFVDDVSVRRPNRCPFWTRPTPKHHPKVIPEYLSTALAFDFKRYRLYMQFKIEESKKIHAD